MLKKGFSTTASFNNVPSIILTLSGCNLKCMFKKDVCVYSFENGEVTCDEAKTFISEHPETRHIVIKGGEPLMYKDALEKFLNDIWRDDMHITIYTNGTLPILNPLANKYRIALYVVNLSNKVFPKPGVKVKNPIDGTDIIFGTSEIEKMHSGINYDNLKNLCLYSTDYLLCFSESPDILQNKSQEIIKGICDSAEDQYVSDMLGRYFSNAHLVYVPRNHKEIAAVKKICLENGINYNDSLY